MTEPLKFFKVDDSTIYQDGFTYSFHRILDPAKLRADLRLQQSFHCALRQEENCLSRCHVTRNWEMDKKGRNFMLGIVKKGDHTHGQEYRDTTPKLRFYKNADDENIHRNGFDYTFYRELDPPKQIADFQWHRSFHCSLSVQKNCRARIYTTGQWEESKREFQYQLGIFKNCFHSHELDQDSNKEDNHRENIIVESASSSTHTKDLDKKEQIRFYKYKQTSVQHRGFVYRFHCKIKGHPQYKQLMWCGRKIMGKQTCNGYIRSTGKWEEDDRGREFQLGIIVHGHDHEPYQIAFQGKDNDDESPDAGLKFYKYMEKNVHRDGHTYSFFATLKSRPPWKQRMRCTRTNEVNKKSKCNGSIWTTGEWETDSLGRLYQRGILRGGHSHGAYEQFLNEDDTAFVGASMDDKCCDRALCLSVVVERRGSREFRLSVTCNSFCPTLPSPNPEESTLPSESSIWTTGEWETDSLGRLYQRGILRGQHSHEAYEQFLNEDAAFVGDGGHMDDKQCLDEDDVVMIED